MEDSLDILSTVGPSIQIAKTQRSLGQKMHSRFGIWGTQSVCIDKSNCNESSGMVSLTVHSHQWV